MTFLHNLITLFEVSAIHVETHCFIDAEVVPPSGFRHVEHERVSQENNVSLLHPGVYQDNTAFVHLIHVLIFIRSYFGN